MELKKSLEKLEELRGFMDKLDAGPGQFPAGGLDRMAELYGQVEDLIRAIEGTQYVEVPVGGAEKAVYKDYISAGWLSGRTYYSQQGRMQLLKVIGKVRSMIEDPGVPEAPTSINQLLRSLRRFRECCQYIEAAPESERKVQDLIWIMLRSQFDRVYREETLPKFGLKSYKPDFGLPDLRTLVEVKFVGQKTDPAEIQEAILADVPGYLNGNHTYAGLVVFVYDAANKLLDSGRFEDDLRRLDGITEVIVVPGIGRS